MMIEVFPRGTSTPDPSSQGGGAQRALCSLLFRDLRLALRTFFAPHFISKHGFPSPLLLAGRGRGWGCNKYRAYVSPRTPT